MVKQEGSSEKIDLTMERLELSQRDATMLVGLFNNSFYRKRSKLSLTVSDSELFTHYLEKGIYENISPGPFFSIEIYTKSLEEQRVKYDFNSPLLIRWLRTGASKSLKVSDFFDYDYYGDRYPDVRESGIDLLDHFLRHGLSEKRIPLKELQDFYSFNKTINGLSDYLAIFESRNQLRLFLSGYFDSRLDGYFQEEFYLEQLGYSLSVTDLKKHYAYAGILLKVRPSCLYNESYYISQVERKVRAGDEIDSLNFSHPFVHWIIQGYDAKISPTPLFAENYYLSTHKDLMGWKGWVFRHYYAFGVNEKFRKASPVFDGGYYSKIVEWNIEGSPLLDYLMRGEAKGIPSAPDVNLSSIPPQELSLSSKIEECALYIQSKSHDLDSELMQSMITRAGYIEPLLHQPRGERVLQVPPIKHAGAARAERFTQIRKALNSYEYDNIVLIPHCRMSGAARVAGVFTSSLMRALENESVLVVTTDLSNFEKPDWFGRAEIFDISHFIEYCGPEEKVLALLDLVRGISPKRVFNINSRLGWELTQTYAKQLSVSFDIFAYLFTYDIDKEGNKVGYPISWLLPSANYLSGILFDNKYLRDEICDRYALPSTLANKLNVLYTPPSIDSAIDCTDVFLNRRKSGKSLKCFWAGRFDRQKRFDVVVDVAKLMPDLEIHVWGKSVLNDDTFDFENLPQNIKLQGEYEDFDEIPLRSFDFFFYTSDWDGLPTVLIDIACSGVPVLSCDSGGITDLFSHENSWLVGAPLSVIDFVDQIVLMQENPDEVQKRAKQLLLDVHNLCNSASYDEAVSKLFKE